MTYMELFNKATRLLECGEITVGEYDQMILPLHNEVIDIIKCERCRFARRDHGISQFKWCSTHKTLVRDDNYCSFAEEDSK